MSRTLLPKRRSVEELAVDEAVIVNDKAETQLAPASNEPPKKSRKTTTPKTRKAPSKTKDSKAEKSDATTSADLNAISKQTSNDGSGAVNDSGSHASDLSTNNDAAKPPAKKSRPKKAKTDKSNAPKDASPDGSGSSNIASSPKDSGKEADGAPEEGSKKPPKETKKPKKRAPPKKTTATPVKRSKKQTKEEVKDMPPPPPPPLAPINRQVAAKVEQVLIFVDIMTNESNLDRDPENRNLISVPYSSFASAVMRMRTHYEIAQSVQECLNDVQDIIIKHFKRNIGPTPDIDWVTIDASKTSAFEDNIQEKIARHGLVNVNLLEIELEMFTRDLLTKPHLFRDMNGEAAQSARLLDAVASAEEETVSEENTTHENVHASAEEGAKVEQGESSEKATLAET